MARNMAKFPKGRMRWLIGASTLAALCTSTCFVQRFTYRSLHPRRSIHSFSRIPRRQADATKAGVDSIAAGSIPRLDARDLSSQDVNELLKKGPVLLHHALPELNEENWCDNFGETLGDFCVVCKEQQGTPTDLMCWEVTVEEFLNKEMMASTHEKPRYIFEEGVLGTKEAHDADLPQSLKLPERLCGRNFFDDFPPRIQPSPCCLVMAGEGARSTLHRDPFEWVGTSICIFGTKLWTFLPPGSGGVQEVDDAVDAERFPYEGYDREDSSIAAGWQSDLDLHTAQEPLDDLAEALDDPPEEWEAAVAKLNDWWAGKGGSQPDPEIMAALPKGVVPRCALQQEGDLLLIPPDWWHQTYGLESSVAVSGQYVNEANSEQVMQHILQWCGMERPDGLESLSAGEKVRTIAELALDTRADEEEEEEGRMDLMMEDRLMEDKLMDGVYSAYLEQEEDEKGRPDVIDMSKYEHFDYSEDAYMENNPLPPEFDGLVNTNEKDRIPLSDTEDPEVDKDRDLFFALDDLDDDE